MKRRSVLLLIASLLVIAMTAPNLGATVSNQAIADAITELDVQRARTLLDKADPDSPSLAFERARLAVYLGDCDSAQAIASAPTLRATPEGSSLLELAKRCAGATAGSVVVDDVKAGLWIRLQDEADRALVPFIVDVSVRARERIGRDLGVDLPRPLRIDLVRDLFSLSQVSGLPLEAAETTGTVAVARWGRITMVSPRATALGYPWEDTLAHEITHLMLSRATRDRAPLWLQEGVAKREESRWREPRPFDAALDHSEVARAALLSGRSVGVDKIGPSIAMLPTPEAASIAFSEVTSFMSYWIEQNGNAALALLLRDLKGLASEDPSAAMRSVTGYDLPAWIARWQVFLREREPNPESGEGSVQASRDLARRIRLGDLAYERGHAALAALHHDLAAKEMPQEPSLRYRAARAKLALGDEAAAQAALGEPKDVRSLHGGWFALHGRGLRTEDPVAAQRAFGLGVSVDPLAEDVACQGQARRPVPPGTAPRSAPLPPDERWRALCESVRNPLAN